MSGGKVLRGGTAYSIARGKVLRGGTAYTINTGKTLVGGTAYRISFRPLTFAGLFANRTGTIVAGSRNSNTTAKVTTSAFGAGYTYWVFSACSGYLGIHKLGVTSSAMTKTTLISNSNGGGIVTNTSAKTVTYAKTTTATSVYGASVLGLQFNSYTADEIEYILKNATYTRVVGRNTSSTGVLQTARSNFEGKIGIIMYLNYICVFSQVNGVITVLYSNCANNPSMQYINQNQTSLSINGTAATAVYGGSMIAVTPN